MMRLALFFIGATLLAGTTITDTINDASGRPILHGSVTFTPVVNFESASNANWVARTPVSATISAGVFSISLEPTVAAGACYAISFTPATIAPRQMAGVPVTSGVLSLASIINANGCTQPSSWLTTPPLMGTACLQAVNGVVVGTWGPCPTSGAVSFDSATGNFDDATGLFDSH